MFAFLASPGPNKLSLIALHAFVAGVTNNSLFIQIEAYTDNTHHEYSDEPY
ncbi:MAG: hypothetical protein NVSMB27_03790 [Ktedonobacteraceae bacterium]